MVDTEHGAAQAPGQTSTDDAPISNGHDQEIASPQPLKADKPSFTMETEAMTEVAEGASLQEASEAPEQTPADNAGTDEATAADIPVDSKAEAQSEVASEQHANAVIDSHPGQESTADSQQTTEQASVQSSRTARAASDARSTATSMSGQRSGPVSSTVFVVSALETIAASKEAKRSKELEEAVQAALDNIKQSDKQPLDPEVIFLPLQLASKTFSIPLQVTALDCIGKLITYSYFAFPSSRPPPPSQDGENEEQLPLIERAIETICDCFENEATPVEIQQQIIKSLLAAVLNDKIVVHGAGLLKAVRQIYNIFIYSRSNQNQQIAQGSLTQMVDTVFDRVRMRLDMKEARVKDIEVPHEQPAGESADSSSHGAPAEGSTETTSSLGNQNK